MGDLGDLKAFTETHRYGEKAFRLSVARLDVPKREVNRLNGIVRKSTKAANEMARTVEELSEFLGPEHQVAVERIVRKAQEAERPHTYDAVLLLVDDAIESFDQLLEEASGMWDETS